MPLAVNAPRGISFGFQAIARLQPGVTLAQANADVARMISLPPPMFARLELRPNVRPLAAEVIRNVGQILWILLAAVGVVLLSACANVSTPGFLRELEQAVWSVNPNLPLASASGCLRTTVTVHHSRCARRWTTFAWLASRSSRVQQDRAVVDAYLDAKIEHDFLETLASKIALAIEKVKHPFLRSGTLPVEEFIADAWPGLYMP